MSASISKKRNFPKSSDKTQDKLSLADIKLTFNKLAKELKHSGNVELAAPTVRRRLLENVLQEYKATNKPLLICRNTEETFVKVGTFSC